VREMVAQQQQPSAQEKGGVWKHNAREREAPLAHETRTDNSQLSLRRPEREGPIPGMGPGIEGVAICQEMVEEIAGRIWKGTNGQRTVPQNPTCSSR
jgi:hypothetical protein